MNQIECWIYMIVLTLSFLGMGIAGSLFGKKQGSSPAMIWSVVIGFYLLMILQMYLVYLHPPPNKVSIPPCWLVPFLG